MFTCFNPIQLKHETNIHLVPCGKCFYCIKRRVNAWGFRLGEEEKHSFTSYFITLTLEDNYLISSENGLPTLAKDQFQKFMKRLRKYEETNGNKNKIKYYACGEYGKLHRPHYHIILFNATEKGIKHAWKDPDSKNEMGIIHFGNVTEASAKYTVKYMSKIKKLPLFEGDDRLPEFALMSKGLGKSYLTEQILDWHKADLLNRTHCNLKGGIKIPMPRYYKDKIYNQEERRQIKEKHTTDTFKEFEEFVIKPNADKILNQRKEAEIAMTQLKEREEKKRNLF